MTWLPPSFIVHPTLPWSLDASAMGVSPEQLDDLPWDRSFEAMRQLEAGAVANPDEGRQVGHYWLRSPEKAPSLAQAKAIGETTEAVRTFAEGVRAGKIRAEDGLPFTDVIHIGIGGSALGPQLAIDALGPDTKGLRMWFMDNTDPDGIQRILEAIGHRLRHTLVVAVSKSGGTAETKNGMLLVQEACARAGLDVATRMVVVTGEGSALEQTAKRESWLRTFPMWDWVGGRTSITSAVGLLPMELAGIDTQTFLSGARDMDEWTRADHWRENPAALLAGCWYAVGGGKGDRAMVVLPYSDRLLLLSRYLQQLVMESLGKKNNLEGREVHQGIVVYGNKGSTDQHAYVQQLRDGRNDFFANFVQVMEDGRGRDLELERGVNAGDYLQGFLLGTRRALRESSRRSVTITIQRVDPYALGGLIALYERAVGLYASLIGINAYHQPGVEAGKKAAGDVLALSRKIRETLRSGGATADALATDLGGDPVELLHLLERLCATRRLVRDGTPPTARYRLPGT